MSRLSFRPRPVDVNRQLLIVRDVSELDNTELTANLEGNDTQAQGEQFKRGPADAQDGLQPLSQPTSHKKKQKPKEIPVPEVKVVPTYTREYLPLYHIPETYIRGKGGTGWAKDDYPEYDLDDEDEDWLQQYNNSAGHSASASSSSSCPTLLLPDARFEKLLWKLDVACADAMERTLAAAGTSTEKSTVAAVANTSYLSREEAIGVMRKAVGGREQVLQDVYAYWLSKRKRHNRPLMRRLQAPTSAADTNPFNVFRPREKVARPQTRRRRENSAECLEKMRSIRENLMQALELGELLVLRERKKREILRVDVGFQRLQLTLRHQLRQHHELVEQEAGRHLREAMHNNSQCEARLSAYMEAAQQAQQTPGLMPGMLDSPLHRVILRKRKRKELQDAMSAERVNRDAISRLPPPPMQPPDQELVFVMRPDPDRLPAATVGPLLQTDPTLLHCAQARRCWRIGRGGRLVFTRVDPMTMERLVQGDEEARAVAEKGAVGGLPVGRLPVASQRLGALREWWEWPADGVPGPWAASLDLAQLPCGVDGSALLLARQLQLQQHHAETAALAALAGERVGQLGATGGGAPAAAVAATATSAAHVLLQQQLQAATAADAAVLAARKVPQPSPSVLAAHAQLEAVAKAAEPSSGPDPKLESQAVGLASKPEGQHAPAVDGGMALG